MTLNIYRSLNEITKYIDDNLEDDIDYNVLAKVLGVNVYTMQRVFTLIVGISLSEYDIEYRCNTGDDTCEICTSGLDGFGGLCFLY